MSEETNIVGNPEGNNDDGSDSEEILVSDALSDKIVKYYGYFEEYSLKSVAKRCVRLIIGEYFKDLCYDNFKFLTFEEMREWVLEEMKQNFEEKVVPLIEQTYPDLDEDEFDAKVSQLEKLYEKEHEEQLESTTKAALKELRIRVRALQKEMAVLKRKYTV